MRENLQGNWLDVSKERFYGYPDLINFKHDTIVHLLLKVNPNHLEIPLIREDKFNQETSSVENLQIINPNRIRLFREGVSYSVIDGVESKTQNVVFENDYVRLLPTKSNVSESKIRLFKYEVQWNDENIIIEFNKILDKPYIQELNERLNREGRKILLEKLNETLVVSFLGNNQRELILPIKEIDEEKIILYGFPEEPYEVIGSRIGV